MEKHIFVHSINIALQENTKFYIVDNINCILWLSCVGLFNSQTYWNLVAHGALFHCPVLAFKPISPQASPVASGWPGVQLKYV